MCTPSSPKIPPPPPPIPAPRFASAEDIQGIKQSLRNKRGFRGTFGGTAEGVLDPATTVRQSIFARSS